MIIRPEVTAGGGPTSATTSGECSNCGTGEHKFLHRLQIQSTYRRVCTSCVLRINAQYFCPICFMVHPSAPPPCQGAYISCTRCYSLTHNHCLGHIDRSTYVCPLCVNPSLPIFNLKKVKDLGNSELSSVSSEVLNDGESRVIDKKAAKALLAAAKITAGLMTKNAAEANSNAERRAREAAAARKRARDALDHLAYLVAREKFLKQEAALAVVQGSGGGSFTVRRDIVNGAGIGSMNLKVGNVSNGVSRRVDASSEVLNVSNSVVGRINGPTEVLAAFSTVELRDGERKEELKIDKLQLGVRLSGLVPMEMDRKQGSDIEEDPSSDHVENCGITTEGPRSLDNDTENHGGKGDRVSNSQVIAMQIDDKLENDKVQSHAA